MLDRENPPSYLQNLLKKNSLYLIIILCFPFTVLSKPLLVKSDSSALIKSDKTTNRSFNIETYSESTDLIIDNVDLNTKVDKEISDKQIILKYLAIGYQIVLQNYRVFHYLKEE